MVLRLVTLAHIAAVAAMFILMTTLISHWHDENVLKLEARRNEKLAARGVQALRATLFTSIAVPVRVSNSMRLKNESTLNASNAQSQIPDTSENSTWANFVSIANRLDGVRRIEEIALTTMASHPLPPNDNGDPMMIHEYEWRVHGCTSPKNASFTLCQKWTIYMAILMNNATNESWVDEGWVASLSWDAATSTLIEFKNETVTGAGGPVVDIPLMACPVYAMTTWSRLRYILAGTHFVENPMTESDEFMFTSLTHTSDVPASLAAVPAKLGWHPTAFLAVIAAFSDSCPGDRETNVLTISISEPNAQAWNYTSAALYLPLSQAWYPPRCIAAEYDIDLSAILLPDSYSDQFDGTSVGVIMEGHITTKKAVLGTNGLPMDSRAFVQAAFHLTSADQYTAVNVDNTTIADSIWLLVAVVKKSNFVERAPQLAAAFYGAGVAMFVVLALSVVVQFCCFVWPMEALIRLVHNAPHGTLFDALLSAQLVTKGENTEPQEKKAHSIDDDAALTQLVNHSGSSLADLEGRLERAAVMSSSTLWKFPLGPWLQRQRCVSDVLREGLKNTGCADESWLASKVVCLGLSAHYFAELGDVLQGTVILYQRLQHVKRFAPAGVLEGTFDQGSLTGANASSSTLHDDRDEAPSAQQVSTSRNRPELASTFLEHDGGPATPLEHRPDAPLDTDVSTMYGLLAGSYVSSAGALDTISFGSSWHNFGASGGSSGRDMASSSDGKQLKTRDNHFRSIVGTMLRVSLGPPAHNRTRGRERGSDVDVAVMTVIVRAIVEFGGVIDVLEPQRVVAYFGPSSTTVHPSSSAGYKSSHGNTASRSLQNPLTVVAAGALVEDDVLRSAHDEENFVLRTLHDLSAYEPADQRKSPIRALVCALCIRHRIKEMMNVASKTHSVEILRALDQMVCFLDKATFLFGNCGNKQRVSRVIFQPRQDRHLEAIDDLNRTALGASIVATMRAARVIEGSLRRMGALNASVSVLPLDCLDMGRARTAGVQSHATGLHSPTTEAAAAAAHSKAASDPELSDSATTASHGSVDNDSKSFVWLFSIVELGSPSSAASNADQRSIAVLSPAKRAAYIIRLYKLFHQVVRVGLSPSSSATGKDDQEGSIARTMKSLVELASFHELVASVQGLLMFTTKRQKLMAALMSKPGKSLSQKPTRYHRAYRTGWRLFGLPSLELQQLEGLEQHVRLLKEYQAATATVSAGGGVRESIARRQAAAQERNAKLDLRTALAATAGWGPQSWNKPTSATNNAAVTEVSTPTSAPPPQSTPVPPTATLIGTSAAPSDLLGGGMLFDVFIPTTHLLDVGALASNALGHPQPQAATPTSHTTPSVRAEDPASDSAVLSFLAPSVSSHETVRGELPLIIKSRTDDDVWWERSSEVLGRGAFSTVYSGRAHDTAPVALKCISMTARHAKHEILENEVNTACALSHDNIVRYHAWVLLDGFLVVVMEYVPCGSLQQLIQQHVAMNIPRQACVMYAKGGLCGLQYLHDMAVVHGDVKPHNMLLTQLGVVKLTDFGSVVKRYEDDDEDVHSGVEDRFRGTAVYTAPEVMRGETPSASSDVFSFGVALYELITGSLPWETKATIDDRSQASVSSVESDVATIRYAVGRPSHFMSRVAEGSIGIVGASQLNPLVSGDRLWLRIIVACLEEDPAQRPTCTTLLEWITASEEIPE